MAKFKRPGKSFRVNKPNYNKNYVCIKQPCPDVEGGFIGATDLEVFLELDEASGTRVDLSVNARDAVESVGSVLSDTGIIGDAARFEPDLDTLEINSSTTLTSTGDYSISCWFNLDTVSNHRGITAKNGAFTLWYFQSSNVFRFTNFDALPTNFVDHSVTPSASTWYHLVATASRTDSRFRIYIDGVAVEQTTTSFANHGNVTLAIGSHELNLGSQPPRNMDGLIDQYFVYSKELTQAEVDFVYNSGSGRTFTEIVG